MHARAQRAIDSGDRYDPKGFWDLPIPVVKPIEVDPDDPATVYASFFGTGPGRVYRLRRSSATPVSMDALDLTQAAFGAPDVPDVNTSSAACS